MNKIMLISLLLISGCVGLHDEPVYLKNGHQIYRAVCNGTMRDIGDCYSLANKRCGGSFELVDVEKENVGAVEQMVKSSEYTRQAVRRNYNLGDTVEGVSDYTGNVSSVSGGVKLKMINRSIYFYCN